MRLHWHKCDYGRCLAFFSFFIFLKVKTESHSVLYPLSIFYNSTRFLCNLSEKRCNLLIINALNSINKMIIHIDSEKLAKIQHLLNFENKLIIKMPKSLPNRFDSIRELFSIDDFFMLQELGVTHSKIRQMWFDDRFDNCLRNQIVFTFEFRLYHSKPCDNQIALFKTRVNRGQYLYSY